MFQNIKPMSTYPSFGSMILAVLLGLIIFIVILWLLYLIFKPQINRSIANFIRNQASNIVEGAGNVISNRTGDIGQNIGQNIGNVANQVGNRLKDVLNRPPS